MQYKLENFNRNNVSPLYFNTPKKVDRIIQIQIIENTHITLCILRFGIGLLASENISKNSMHSYLKHHSFAQVEIIDNLSISKNNFPHK